MGKKENRRGQEGEGIREERKGKGRKGKEIRREGRRGALPLSLSYESITAL